MRGNSGFLRWLLSSYSWMTLNQKLIVGCTLCLVMVASITEAGPVNVVRSRRMIRDVFSELDTQSQNLTQSTDGICLHDGNSVPKTSVECEMKSGCRAIQKTGYCCPDYQCHCERDGRIYANGEKLVDPEEPCKGCYCQGGEFLCNDVNCYIRHDCEPKFIPGRCCPEYDNCPPLDSSRLAISSTTQNILSSTLSATTSEQPATSSSTLTSAIKQPEVVNNNPLGIKIKEITKPEEIRIIDEKPKPVYQLIKPLDSGGSNQPKIYAPTAPRIEPIPVLTQTVPVSSSNSNQASKTVEVDDSHIPPNPPSSSTTTQPADEPVKITVFDSSSNISETSTTETAQQFENVEAKLGSNEQEEEQLIKLVQHTDSVEMNLTMDAEMVSSTTDASSSTPDADSDLGKEVVIVDRNGQTKPITVFGVEGLQRGDELDEALEFEEKKSASKRSDSPTISPDTSTTEFPADHSTGAELIYENASSTGGQKDDFKTVSEIDPVGSGSDDFIQVAFSTGLGVSTSEGPFPDDSRYSSTSTEEQVVDSVYHELEGSADLDDSQAHESVFETVYREPDPVDQNSSQLQSSTSGPKPGIADLIDDDEEIGPEPNPAYPNIGDDISVYQTQVQNAEDDMTAKEEKMLPEVIDMLANSTVHMRNETNDSHESWLKTLINDTLPEGVPIDDETALIPQERSPGEPLLIPEWERNSTESIAFLNITADDSLEDESLLPSIGPPTDVDTSSSSGDGPNRMPPKYRESTTTKLIGSVEEGSGRLEHDPKEDNESLKYHEDGGDGSLAKPHENSGLRYLVSAINNSSQNRYELRRD